MLFQVPVDIDAKYANAEQPSFFTRPVAGLGVQTLFYQEAALTAPTLFYRVQLGVRQSQKQDILYEQPVFEEESEDAILVTSGILPRLIAQAKQESPSLNWEQELNEM